VLAQRSQNLARLDRGDFACCVNKFPLN
jgi:hypothetical protein